MVTTLNLLKKDLNRYFVLIGDQSLRKRSRVILSTPAIWIIIGFRIGQYLQLLSKKRPITKIAYFSFKLFYLVLCFLCGIDLSLDAAIDEGLYIGHYGGIVIHPETSIGKNCNISHGVTIGEGGRGERRGVPKIGDFVYIGPGSVIFGTIKIGNRVAIGANTVVTKSVPDNAVVVGVPARIISHKGSHDFIVT